MEFDLLANGGLIFADCLCNGSFSRTVSDTSKDDPSFFQSKVSICVCIGHIRYLPFLKAKSDMLIKTKCKSNFHKYLSGSK